MWRSVLMEALSSVRQQYTVELEPGKQAGSQKDGELLALGYKNEFQLDLLDLLLVDSAERFDLGSKGILLRLWIIRYILELEKLVGLRSDNYHWHIRCKILDIR